MKKDNDIRNFFKSSGDKTQVIESKMKPVVEIPKEKVINKQKEENKKNFEENIENKQKKGKKRKGADLDLEDKEEGSKQEENLTKKKKVNNTKNKDGHKIIENPIPIIKEEIKIKIDSKGRKIIDDDDEEECEPIKIIPKIEEKELKVKNEKKNEITNIKVPQSMNDSIDKTATNSNINQINIKPAKIINKPEENKNVLKPIDASSFFSTGGTNQNITLNKHEEEISPTSKKVIDEEKNDDVKLEEKIVPMDVDNKNFIENHFVDDFDIDAMDLDMIAKDMFSKEPEIKIIKDTNPEIKNENEFSLKQKEILEIKEKGNKTTIQSNSILNNRNIKPFEATKTNSNITENNLKITNSDNLIANRFIQNLNNQKNYDISMSKPINNIQQNNSNNLLNKNSETRCNNNSNLNNKPNLQPESLLWTDRHHPKTVDEIIGNQAVVRKLIDWLNNWDDVVLNGNKREIDFAANNNYSTRGKSKIENINARACMISGPPGIGKTTTVRLVAKMSNYKTFELNASDQRNKQIISSTVGYLMDNKTISNMTIINKNLIIMDEIDGMGGNEDKGGIKALIDIIKKTKLPIICICNDIQNQKIRNLLNYCYELKFSKPDKRLVVKRLSDICRIEKFNITPESLEYLCESVGNDIRQCLNFLEMRARSQNILNHQDMKAKYNQLYSKDSELMISVFDSCKKMLTKNEFRKLRFGEKMDLFFIDFEFLPNLIYENYLSCHGNNKTQNDLRRMAESSNQISLGDVIERKIKRTNEWTLLPNRGMHSCLAPAIYSGNFISYTKFPDMFGKISKMRKILRQLKELKQIFNFSLQAIKEEIVPLIFSKITNYLLDLGREGVERVIHVLHTHRMSLMLFKENLFDLQPNDSILKKYEKLNAGIKSHLTKKLNEEFKTSIVKKKKKGEEENTQKFDQDGNIIEENPIEEDEEGGESEVEVESNVEIVSKVSKNETKKTKKTKK